MEKTKNEKTEIIKSKIEKMLLQKDKFLDYEDLDQFKSHIQKQFNVGGELFYAGTSDSGSIYTDYYALVVFADETISFDVQIEYQFTVNEKSKFQLV